MAVVLVECKYVVYNNSQVMQYASVLARCRRKTDLP